jgi:hypothetical protein
MVPEGSLPHSQQPATCPCPKKDRSCPCPPPPSNINFSKINFNIIPPSTSRSAQIRDSCIRSVPCLSFYGEELLAPRPTPQATGRPLLQFYRYFQKHTTAPYGELPFTGRQQSPDRRCRNNDIKHQSHYVIWTNIYKYIILIWYTWSDVRKQSIRVQTLYNLFPSTSSFPPLIFNLARGKLIS